LGGSQRQSGYGGIEKNSCPCQTIISNPVHSHLPNQLRYPDSTNIKIHKFKFDTKSMAFERAQISLEIKDPALDSQFKIDSLSLFMFIVSSIP
jgi:hypothetical protein